MKIMFQSTWSVCLMALKGLQDHIVETKNTLQFYDSVFPEDSI